MSLIKKKPKFIRVGTYPILIVGEKMGQQRKGQDTFALEGNGTGDFIHEAIEGLENIILTNVVNYYYPGNFNHKMSHIQECTQDLIDLVEIYKPRKIIALGNIAEQYLIILGYRRRTVKFPHPSWINRFKRSERSIYINQLKQILCS